MATVGEDALWGAWILLAMVALALWPYLYIRFRKGEHPFLFVSAVFGAMFVTHLLLSAIVLPIYILLVKFIPQLEVMGMAQFLAPLIGVSEVVASWYFIVIFPVLYFALPPLFYRRYDVFRAAEA